MSDIKDGVKHWRSLKYKISLYEMSGSILSQAEFDSNYAVYFASTTVFFPLTVLPDFKCSYQILKKTLPFLRFFIQSRRTR